MRTDLLKTDPPRTDLPKLDLPKRDLPKINVAGENALIIYFGDKTDPAISARIQQAAHDIEALLGKRLIDLVPSYASLLVIYDPFACDHLAIRHQLNKLLNAGSSKDLYTHQNTHSYTHLNTHPGEQENQSKVIHLPAYYSTESGPDLAQLAASSQLSIEDVIRIHSQTEYRVYAIGFAPGFAYLGELDPRIAAPRLATPRQKVPKGAIAIADRQTAVYPETSPGGWNLIGLCPTPMFNPHQEPTMPLQVGDRVTFSPISRETYLSLGGELPEDADTKMEPEQ